MTRNASRETADLWLIVGWLKNVWAVVERSEGNEDFSQGERKTNDSCDPGLTVNGVRLRCCKSISEMAGQALRCHPVYLEYTSIIAIYVDCGETYREEGRLLEGSLQRFGIKLRRLTVRRTAFTVLLEEKAGCCSLHPAYMYVLCQRAFCICAVATSGGSPRFFLFLLFLLFYLSEPLQLSVSFPFHSSPLPSPLLCDPLRDGACIS